MSLTDKILRLFIKDETQLLTPHERETFFLDTFRSGVDGIIQTLGATIFLLIGIQYFGVSDFWKSIISSSIHFGMIISLFSSSSLHITNRIE
ncbi:MULTISPECIES: hypothetical protein [unclassified Oceanispirochaeta]|uniref:hypothetical protein n=1 Tax=unclassified Oceanispirochaeta TaxID=2635722 RepID=UPI001C12D1AE|nr:MULTISPECIES: hypothetical protein [unclassified Oceanispirochaeta]